MPLTPEDVANKQFSSVRLREGYDMEEVDQFLDEVEQEIARLMRENDDLRGRLTAAERAVGDAERRTGDLERRAAEAERRAGEAERRAAEASERVPAQSPAEEPQEAPHEAQPGAQAQPSPQAADEAEHEAPEAETGESEGAASTGTVAVAQPSAVATTGIESAAGILALAQRTADEHVAEARTQADTIIGDARTRADAITREAEDKRRQTIGTLERERMDLEGRIEGLKSFEREYRTRLRSYLEGQLQQLEHVGPVAVAGGQQPALGAAGGTASLTAGPSDGNGPDDEQH